ncbi:MAG: hypothetical protein EA408_06700 [Marinilabiliales bacterium]|nr:MAG: hypothetical protein EA408_06700 [Marinilabiliales bacterium]
MQRLFLFMLLFLPLAAKCGRTAGEKGDPVARVYNKYLYRHELAGIFPANISPADSAKLAMNYIDKWIRNQLFLKLAEENLPPAEKNLDKQIADYRASLLIHKYQRHLLGQKLDSMITMREIEEYHNSFGSNFILDRPAIRGVFIKVFSDAPNRERISEMFGYDDDMVQLESYGNRYGVTFYNFRDIWIYAGDIVREFPPGSVDAGGLTANTGYLTATDENFYYFLGVVEYKPSKSVMPISLAAQKIKSIILNRRKMQFLNELEKSVFTEGINKNAIQYF